MSGLEDLYREIILDHYRSPRNRGELPVPPAIRTEGLNPLCGDEIVVYLELDDPAKGDDATITDLRIGGQGCSISQSSASMMSAAVKGHTVGAARHLTRAFKSMMSIHEGELGGDGTESEGDSDTESEGDSDTESEGDSDTESEGDSDTESEGDSGAESEADDGVVAPGELPLGDLDALKGVVKFPVRIKCATLGWNTLLQGFDDAGD
jgi:nitrogen fixation NifU-like protein